MKNIAVFSFVSIAAMTFGLAPRANSCDCGAPAVVRMPVVAQMPVVTQTYRLMTQTVFDERQVTAFRIDTETVYEDHKVTTLRPVTETQMRENRYSVAKPVYETSQREEHYTVMKPVTETQIVDASYNRVRDVMETSEREEHYFVQRPVYETSERENRYMVQKPIYETAVRDECSTVCEPQTTYVTRYADHGCWQDYQVLKPGPVYNQPVCVPGGCSTDPCTGLTTYIAPTTGYQQVQAPPTVQVNRVYRPNIVAEQIPQTTMVQKVVVRKVPFQVCRMVNEEVVQKVPVTVCRMVQEEQVRKVPVTVCRQVVERVENKVPVTTCKMVAEEMVRQVPVTTCKMVMEEHVDQVPVQVCKMVPMEETVRVPRVVEKRTPVIQTYRVPRTIVYKVPIDPCTGAVLAMPGPAVGVPNMQAMPGMQTSSADPMGGATTTFEGGAGNGANKETLPPDPKQMDSVLKKEGGAEGSGAAGTGENAERSSGQSDVQKDATVKPGLNGINPVPAPEGSSK